MTIEIENIGTINKAAEQFVKAIGKQKLIALYGPMGAGKTTFVKAICETLGVVDTVNSPTFSIVNEYETVNGDSIYHFDFYRLKSPREALDFGIEEYFASGALCLMEWPEELGELLPDDALKVTIEVGANNQRIVKF